MGLLDRLELLWHELKGMNERQHVATVKEALRMLKNTKLKNKELQEENKSLKRLLNAIKQYPPNAKNCAGG